MEKEYSLKRRVYRNGDGLVITLPKIWVEREGISEGSTVELRFNTVPGLKVLLVK
jgi:hypothetical protein